MVVDVFVAAVDVDEGVVGGYGGHCCWWFGVIVLVFRRDWYWDLGGVVVLSGRRSCCCVEEEWWWCRELQDKICRDCCVTHWFQESKADDFWISNCENVQNL